MFRDVLMILASTPEMIGAILFKTFGGMLFGPTAFEESIDLIIELIC